MLARKQINKLLYNLYISSVYISLSGHTEHAYNLFLSPRYYAYTVYAILLVVYFSSSSTFTGSRAIYPPVIYLPTLRRSFLAACNGVHHPDRLLAQQKGMPNIARRFQKAPTSNTTIDCYFVQHISVIWSST